MSLPIGEAFTPEELERAFRVEEVRPERNPDHAFAIRVPREWGAQHHESMDREVGTEEMTALASWRGPEPDDEPPPLFVVEAIRLEREITAKNFLLRYASRTRMKGHFLREVSPFFADAMGEQPIEGASLLVRLAALIEGDRAFVLIGFTKPERYLELEQILGAMVASFRVVTRSAKQTIERRMPYALLGEAVRFQHPESWRPRLLDGSDDQRAAVALYGLDWTDAIGGILHVEAQRGRPLALEAEYDRVLTACRASGLIPNGPPKDVGLDVESERYRGLGTRMYPAMIEGNALDQEIWITLLEADDLALRVWLTTPAKSASFDHWAVNRRALEIVLGTVR